MSVKEQILEIVGSSKSGVAYSQLMAVDEFRGECHLTHAEYPMVHYWEGLSRPAAEAILELTQAGRLKQIPTDTLAYIAQGQTLELPVFTFEHVAKAKELEHPHWMPVLLLIADD